MAHAQRGGRKGTELHNFAHFGQISDALSAPYLDTLHVNHCCLDWRQDICIAIHIFANLLPCVFFIGTLGWGATPGY